MKTEIEIFTQEKMVCLGSSWTGTPTCFPTTGTWRIPTTMVRWLLLKINNPWRKNHKKEARNKMLLKQDLVRKVRDYFSLNIYEAKVWLALLKKGIASAGEVASLSEVPRSRTYDVLESLEKRGFAIAKLGKPVKYIGVKPKMIIEKLKNNVRKDAEEKMFELARIKTTNEFETLESLYLGGLEPVRKEDISIALKGRSNISNHVKE